MKQRILFRMRRGSEGSVAAVTALILVGLMGAASLAIDIGHILTVRNELQNVTDATALAAAGNLIKDQGGVAVRDATAAIDAGFLVAQRQSELLGLPALTREERSDVGILFGEWNLYQSNPELAWTEIGETCSAYSNANAVRVTIKRAAGLAYGPVTNFVAGAIGLPTSEVQATATAYLGYTLSTQPGTVSVPLALPQSVLQAAADHERSWWASLLRPKEAVASTPKTYVFKDTGGGFVNTSVTTANPLDPAQAYLFTVGSGDAVPGTIWNILEKIYNPSKTGSILYVDKLELGKQIYARSEFKYGNTWMGPIFQRLQKAYNYKTTGNANTAPPAGTPWRVTLAVYGTTPNPLASRRRKAGFMSLARLLAPFLPSPAYACYTMPPPKIYVNGFVNADITGATYASGDEGNYTYPKTISGVRYTDKKDFLTRYPSSVWNVNSLTITNVTDVNTVSPPGTTSGGMSNHDINPGAPSNTGAFASIPRLVK